MISVGEPDAAATTPVPVRRNRLAWVLVAVAVVAAAIAVVVLWPGGDPGGPAVGAASSPAPVVDLTPATLPRPAPDAPPSEHQAWVAQEARAAMKLQTEGLLAGDFDRFAGNAQPGNRALRAELQRRFRTLRALRVTRFDQRIDGQPFPLAPQGKPKSWRVVQIADLCFVEPTCETDEAVFDTEWTETPAGPLLAAVRVHDRTSPCYQCRSTPEHFNRPWETTELVAQIGKRTLVAVPPRYRNRLAELSRRAEAAAAVADRYKVGDGTVDRYRVFVADDRSWRLWYAGYPGSWVAGCAVPTGRDRIEVAVLASELTAGYTDELLRHELAHVSTLRNNTYYGQRDVWWLVEGMAEYVQQQDTAADAYGKKDELRRLLRQRSMRSVMVSPPRDDASLADAEGRYAVGYYALGYLFQRYGKQATLDFFRRAVQFGTGLDSASRAAFGKPWAAVDRECAAHVRKV
jgi:hypothetical protein